MLKVSSFLPTKRNSFAFAIAIFMLGIAFSCTPKKQNNGVLPLSNGMPGEVSILAEPSLEETMGSKLDMLFDVPEPGLKPAEPSWYQFVLKPEDAKGDALTMSAILLLRTPDNNSKNLKALWSEAEKKAKNIGGVMIAHDVWAKPQTVILAEAKDPAALFNLLSEQKVVNKLRSFELQRGLSGGFSSNRYTDSVMNRVEADFGFTFPIPPQFRLTQSNHELLWFIWEGKDFRSNLFVNIVPDSIATSAEQWISLRDTFCKRYVKGSNGTAMVTSRSSEYPYTFDSIPTESKPLILMRGWWILSGEWQRGVFRRYAFHDAAGKRTIYLEGFLEAPNIANLMHYRMYDLIAARFKLSGDKLSSKP